MPDTEAARPAAQKKTLRAAEQDRAEIAAERAAYRDKVEEIGAERLVFVDESGLTTRLARTHARAPRGQRARGSVPFGGRRRLTVLGALASDGLIAAMSIEAATDTPVFLA